MADHHIAKSMARLTREEAVVMALYADGKDGAGVALVLGHARSRIARLRLSAIEKLQAQNLTHAAVLFDRSRRPTR